MNVYEFTVTKDEVGTRLDKFLSERIEDVSRSQISNWIKQGLVTVGDSSCPVPRLSLAVGMNIRVCEPPPVPSAIVPQAVPLNVVFSDDDVIVLDKLPNQIVHPGAGNPDGTLVNGLMERFGGLSSIGLPTRPGVVHRIDGGTSGLLVFARTDAAHHNLAKQFEAHSVNRTYIALVWGRGLADQGTVDTLYGRAPNHRIKFSSRVAKGKRAVTHWELVAELGPCSLIRLNLETGRTHQIRVHMADLGYPLVGDPLYGRKQRVQTIPRLRQLGIELGLTRQALHAQTLGFVHPTAHTLVEFRSRIPLDLASLIEDLGGENVLLATDNED